MAQPPTYDRQFNFQNQQALTPAAPLPAQHVDAEYNAVKVTLDAILANLALIQRDDGALANHSVGRDQLAIGLLTGFEPPVPWTTATTFGVYATVFYDGVLYSCVQTHVSGTFSTDLSAGKWTEIFDFGDYLETGWSPELAVENDDERRVLKIAGWIGGVGSPSQELLDQVGLYVGADGYTATIGEAINIRGATGAGAVDSVFGRAGNVIAVAGDYAASEVGNDSTVDGDFVDDALNALKTAVEAKQDSDADLTALADLSSAGVVVRTGAATYANRAVAAGTAISVTNGDGVAGNPTVAASLASQAQAQAGASNTVLMTPLRTAEAITALSGGVIGGVMDYAGSTAPSGWLLCYGQAVSRTTYSALFAAIGTTYGSDDESTFKLPDCRGRVAAGKDDMGGSAASRLTNTGTGNSGIDGSTLGAAGGVDRRSQLLAEMPSHNHPLKVPGGSPSSNGGIVTDIATPGFGPSTGLITGHAGGNAMTLVQPTIVFNKIIYTGVLS